MRFMQAVACHTACPQSPPAPTCVWRYYYFAQLCTHPPTRPEPSGSKMLPFVVGTTAIAAPQLGLPALAVVAAAKGIVGLRRRARRGKAVDLSSKSVAKLEANYEELLTADVEPVTLQWSDVQCNLRVKGGAQRPILQGVTGSARPGRWGWPSGPKIHKRSDDGFVFRTGTWRFAPAFTGRVQVGLGCSGTSGLERCQHTGCAADSVCCCLPRDGTLTNSLREPASTVITSMREYPWPSLPPTHRLLAIMGPSGSGKTTLLTAMAQQVGCWLYIS